MITIFAKSWDANSATDGLLMSAAATEQLRAKGFEVKLVDDWCQNENCGCESDTDEEAYAIDDVYCSPVR